MQFRILLLFLVSISASAQISPPPPPPMVDSLISHASSIHSADSLLQLNTTLDHVVTPKKFKDNFRSKYRSSEFNYTTVKPREALGQKLERAIAKILDKIFGNVNPGKSAKYADVILRILAFVIGGLVLYFLVKFLMGSQASGLFAKRNRKIMNVDEGFRENIHEIDFLARIVAFEKEEDYRSAIRFHFLAVLKKLSDKKLIIWNPEKTNKDYVAELAYHDCKTEYKNLVYIFDNVWYGEFAVDSIKYQQLKKRFLDFKI